ncbi:MAG: hypothetical protein FJZ01_08080 [Candidatus Sericytochromatia bacterium]|nr:hypothetical protein [Candidatus Tanganyikabacteria bacterium]
MPSDVTGGPRARVVARNLPLDMGGVAARVDVAEVDLLPKNPDGVLDLDDKHPKVAIRSARAIVAGDEISRIAAKSAKGPVSDLRLRLLGQDRFEATGQAEGGIPFKASGKVGTAAGKLAFFPQGLDLTAGGAQVHLDIPGRAAKVAVPQSMLDEALAGAPIARPKLTWQGPRLGTLAGALHFDGQQVPMTAKIGLGVAPDGWLRFGVSDVRLRSDGADIAVDLATRTAKITVPPAIIERKVEESARRELQNPALIWLGPNAARLEGDVPLTRLLGPDAGPGSLKLQAYADLAAKQGKIEARLNHLSLAGDDLSLTTTPATGLAAVHVSTALVARTLQKAKLDGLRVTEFAVPAPGQWRLRADLGGTALEAAGGFEARDGKLRFDIASLDMPSGADHIALRLDPAANLVRATVPEAALTRLIGAGAPLPDMALKLAPGGKLQTAGKFKLLGLPLPIRLDGTLSLGSDGQPRYAVARTRMVGIDVTAPLRWFGLTLGKLDPKGSWEGNTLKLAAGGLPPGMALHSLETGAGVLEVALRPDKALPGGAPGVRFDGRTLEVDPAAVLPLPGKVVSAHAGPSGFDFQIRLDGSKMDKFVKLPTGVTFDGQTFRADPSAAAGRPVPGTLTSLSAGPEGGQATIAVAPEVFAPLQKLPPGVKFDGTGFRVDPKQGKALPGRLTDARATGSGLALDLALTDKELKGDFNLGATGVAWDGQALTVDVSGGFAGTRATGAAVVDGDLVVEVGDGQSKPAASASGRVVAINHSGRARVMGFLMDNPSVELRPKTPGGQFDLQSLDKAAITVLGGKIIVPPAKLQELIKAKLGPADYKKLEPTYDGRRLTIRFPLPIGSIPFALRFEKTRDGNLQLAPSGFFGSIPLLEWPQRLIGLLLSPVTFLIPGADGVKIDLKAASGVALPDLKNVDATQEGLVLDFGGPSPAGSEIRSSENSR